MVSGSTISIVFIGPRSFLSCAEAVLGSWMRSKLYLTAAASNGVPSWNLRPLRSLNGHSLPSGVDVQLVASAGLYEPSLSRISSGSATRELNSHVDWYGSSGPARSAGSGVG